MESLRNPSTLAAIAAVLLGANLVVLSSDVGTVDGVEVEGLAGATDGTAADGAGTTVGGGGEGATAGGGTAGDGTTTGGDGTAATSGAGGDGGGRASGSDVGAGGAAALAAPTTGAYTYEATGSWGLTGGGFDEETPFPDEVSLLVSVDDAGWTARIDGGDDYVDELRFSLADGGLEWTTWDLTRSFGGQPPATTAYVCEGGDAFHVAGNEVGRSVLHGCEAGAAGLASDGTIVTDGTVQLALGDGSTVDAVKLTYDYTVGGDGVEGQGRLELWLEPTTGLRLQEVRDITSTTNGEITYREAATFTLRSLDPA